MRGAGGRSAVHSRAQPCTLVHGSDKVTLGLTRVEGRRPSSFGASSAERASRAECTQRRLGTRERRGCEFANALNVQQSSNSKDQ